MSYAVKEIFYTLQGEGALTGRPAVFCRFSGCNLWSGREEDRAGAACPFCDTDFVGTDGSEGGRYADAEALADKIATLWPERQHAKFVVCTGGEPLLQLDPPLIDALHRRGFEIAVERLEGKFKASQNRTERERAGAIAGLAADGDPPELVAQIVRPNR